MTRDDLIYLYPEFAKTIAGYLAEDKEWMSRDALRGEMIPHIGSGFAVLRGHSKECDFTLFLDDSLLVEGGDGREVLFMEVIRRL